MHVYDDLIDFVESEKLGFTKAEISSAREIIEK